MVEVKKSEMASTYWGATEKVCPMCAEKIPVAALQCPFCKATYSDMRPVSREDVLGEREAPETRLIQRRATVLLVFSLIGFTSPLALIIGWIWYSRDREEIAQSSTARALVLASLGICIAYLILIVIGLMVFTVSH